MRRLALLVLVLALVIPGSAFAAVNVFWTSVGSAGTVDPAGAVPSYNNATVSYPAASTTLNPILIRYNVTDTNANNVPGWTTLEVGTAGITPNDSVQIALFSEDPCSGSSKVICSFTITGQGTCPAGCTFSSTTFDFSANAYFILAQLSRTANTSNPQLFYLSIH